MRVVFVFNAEFSKSSIPHQEHAYGIGGILPGWEPLTYSIHHRYPYISGWATATDAPLSAPCLGRSATWLLDLPGAWLRQDSGQQEQTQRTFCLAPRRDGVLHLWIPLLHQEPYAYPCDDKARRQYRIQLVLVLFYLWPTGVPTECCQTLAHLHSPWCTLHMAAADIGGWHSHDVPWCSVRLFEDHEERTKSKLHICVLCVRPPGIGLASLVLSVRTSARWGCSTGRPKCKVETCGGLGSCRMRVVKVRCLELLLTFEPSRTAMPVVNA